MQPEFTRPEITWPDLRDQIYSANWLFHSDLLFSGFHHLDVCGQNLCDQHLRDQIYATKIYAISIYAMKIYATAIYVTRIYSRRIYVTRIYATRICPTRIYATGFMRPIAFFTLICYFLVSIT